jgi:2-polyprenyl-6-methoxyphenol hydroxylase-like FAD-dependent oxidoreductase
MRAIVIGSGIAGLSAALAFRKVGIATTIYERAPALREVGAGISLWANALRALDTLGAGDAIRKASLGLVQSELRADCGYRKQVAFAGEYFERKLGVKPFVAMIHRAELVETLARMLPEGAARYGFECIGVEQNGDRIAVRFANGHQDEADVVIGADGIKSAVRAALFGPEPPRYAGYTCWRGVSPRPAAIAPGYLGEWWGRGQRFGITTLTKDRVYWFAVQNAPANGHAEDERAEVIAWFQGWAEPVAEILESTPRAAVIRNDILDRPPSRTWSSGRVGLIGDAAHPTTPNMGQGGCLAIEDGVVLARTLTSHQDPAAAWEAFSRERYPRTSAITQESWRFGKIGQWENRVACWLRNRAFGLLLPRFGSRTLPKYASFDPGPLPAYEEANQRSGPQT